MASQISSSSARRKALAIGLGVVLAAALVGVAAAWRFGDEGSGSAVRASVADHADDFPLADDEPSPRPSRYDVLVAIEDIPACTDEKGWADAMQLVKRKESAIPDGALASTSIVGDQVTYRDIPEGNVIKAQLFVGPSACSKSTG